jgi:hypothetical protein
MGIRPKQRYGLMKPGSRVAHDRESSRLWVAGIGVDSASSERAAHRTTWRPDEGICAVLQVTLVVLVAGTLFLANRWLGARAEIVRLRQTVATLKRQLGRRP